MFFLKPKLNILALDIGDGSIEALTLQNNSRVRFYQRVELLDNTVVDGVIVNEKNFISSLSSLVENYKKQIGGFGKKLAPATLSLPESKVFISCFDLELKDGEDLEKRVEAEAEKIIPWQRQELCADFISKKDKDIYHIVYAAALRSLVGEYKKACVSIGLDLAAVSVESLSLGRALLTEVENSGAALILDIGARATNISIFSKDNLLALSVTVPIAGQDFSKALSQDKGLSLQEAEIFKKNGDNFFRLNKKSSYPALYNLAIKISQETQKTISYFEKKTNIIIEDIILAGGSSLLNGIDVFLGDKLKKNVIIGNPLKKISNPDIFKNKIAPILFSDVIGQALNQGDSKKEKINLLKKYDE